MILGVGTDIIEVDRIRKIIDRYQRRFLDRIFTENELLYCFEYKQPYERFAARFAAKEAVVKALGTGFHGINWLDIEIVNDLSGKPTVKLSQAINSRFNFPDIKISISHCHAYATAFAVWSER